MIFAEKSMQFVETLRERFPVSCRIYVRDSVGYVKKKEKKEKRYAPGVSRSLCIGVRRVRRN